jgi:hypothetical protein
VSILQAGSASDLGMDKHDVRPPTIAVASLFDWWITARQNTHTPMRKGLASLALLTPWVIWKHRNNCIFNNARPSLSNLVNKIRKKQCNWIGLQQLG